MEETACVICFVGLSCECRCYLEGLMFRLVVFGYKYRNLKIC
jgi:hypothetical protein